MTLKNIEVKRIAPTELPMTLCFKLNQVYYTELSRFITMYDCQEQVLYVNNKVPEEDIHVFLTYASFTGPYIGEPKEDGGLDSVGDYIFKEYGDKVWASLHDAYWSRQRVIRHERAQKQAAGIIPMIKAINIDDEIENAFDEDLVSVICSAGTDVNHKTVHNLIGYGTKYVFWLGYLIGTGKVKLAENE